METSVASRPIRDPSHDARLLSLLLVSDLYAFREALSAVLERDPTIGAVRCADPTEAAPLLTPELGAVLVDTALPDGLHVTRRLRRAAPYVPIVAYPVRETDVEVITWAEAGATGYIPRSVRLGQFVDVLKTVLSGEQVCPGQVAASLMRRLADIRMLVGEPRAAAALTKRERQVADLVASRLDDKEIAQHLDVSLGTTKTHVHNVLRKLKVRRRREVAGALQGHPPSPLI